MMLLLLWSLLVLITTSIAARTCNVTTNNLNRFDFPAPSCRPGNYSGINSYSYGTKLTIKWATTYPYISLVIFQEGSRDLGTLLFNVTKDVSTYEFSGYPPQPASNGQTYYFAVFATGSTNAVFTSEYINLTDTPASSSTNSLMDTPSTTIVSLLTSAASTTPTSGQTAPTASDSAVPTTSSGTYIGIGVGVGLGVATVVGAVVAWILLRRLRAAPIDRQPLNSVPVTPLTQTTAEISVAPREFQPYHYPQELEQRQILNEMEHPRYQYALLHNTSRP